jgi:acetyl-CoA carboxylase carboxyl transferase subunit alpha
MSIHQALSKVKELQTLLLETQDVDERLNLKNKLQSVYQKAYDNMGASDRLIMARHPHRPKAQQYVDALITDFHELKGDRQFRDDPALLAGIGKFMGIPITILAQNKGNTIEEKKACNFGMLHPEGYRKAIRLAKQAEKFKRPILNLIDTSGAYPGVGAEERGQGQAIGDCLMTFSDLKVPIISIVIGEGGSGGALALSVADRLIMLENAVYSILSPEGFAAILYKDESRVAEATEKMGITAYDLYEKQIIDHIIKEPVNTIFENFDYVVHQLNNYISQELKILQSLKTNKLLDLRSKRLRNWGGQV